MAKDLNIDYNFNYTKGKEHNPATNYAYVSNPLLSETEIKGGAKNQIMYADLISIGQFINFGYLVSKNNFSIKLQKLIDSIHTHFEDIYARLKKLDDTTIVNPSTGGLYWYAGAGPIDSSTTPGSNYNWHQINGAPTQIATGELNNDTSINWVLAVPTSLNLNHISNGEDVTDAYDVTTVTCADGVTYKVFTQIAQSKKTDRIFIA